MAGQIKNRGENAWQIKVFLGRDGNGKRKYFAKTIHGPKRLAQKELTKHLGLRDAGEMLVKRVTLVKDYLELWLSTTIKKQVRENTYESYANVVKTHLIPGLGMYRLSDLQGNYKPIQSLYDEMIERNLSPRTVRYAHSMLSAAFNQAVDDGELIRNPCKRCKLPAKAPREIQYWTAEEVKKFLKQADRDRFFCLFLISLSSGMRPGEVFGLQWSDINFEGRFLSVRRSLKFRAGGGFYLAPPKTKSSRRRIPLSATDMITLKAHRRIQASEIMANRKVYRDLGLVFANELGLPMRFENVTRRHFLPITEKAQIRRIRLYDMRHTCATLLLLNGTHPKVVQERLGHATIVQTLDTYSHVLPTLQKTAVESLERLMVGQNLLVQ